MRILVLGPTIHNGGPDNANRQIIAHWPKSDELVLVSSKSKGAKITEAIIKGASCDVIVSLGTGIDDRLPCRILSSFGKPYVHFCHGYIPYENDINNLGLSTRKIRDIVKHVERASFLATNSRIQEKFILSQMPSIDGKIVGFPLGIDKFVQRARPPHDGPKIIAVSGGSRPVKGNDVVARAVGMLRSRNSNFELELQVYGHLYAKDPSFDEACSAVDAHLMGQVSHSDFEQAMSRTDIFIMNSRYEPFGLSALDALQAGTSVLLSKNCGVSEILNLEQCDVIENCEDAEEVASKAAYLIDHPNAERLYKSLDFSVIGWDVTAARIRDICEKVVSHE